MVEKMGMAGQAGIISKLIGNTQAWLTFATWLTQWVE
jgi:hypothetical protein